jgi:hypothetical protein
LALKGLSDENGMALKMKVLSPDKTRQGLAILNKRTRMPGTIFFKNKIGLIGGLSYIVIKGTVGEIGMA